MGLILICFFNEYYIIFLECKVVLLKLEIKILNFKICLIEIINIFLYV